ncbi:peptidoglycan DD-metalloendopeptidase family protein [Caenispirillum salinarum]|uniref:peptidoglycan DD-metalloendopeptidase family protein n=1 Tax=Caenispirillum salinarum TaxID=859058 RepID=UPI00384B9828
MKRSRHARRATASLAVAGVSALAMVVLLGWPGPSPSKATPQAPVAAAADAPGETGGATLVKASVNQPQKLAFAPVAPPKPPAPPITEQTLKIKSGDTLMAVLVNAGVNRTEAHNSIEALREVWDPRKLRPGDEITVTFDAAAAQGGEVFKGFSFEPQPALRVGAVRDTDGAFAPAEEKAPVLTQAYRAEGTITASLFQNGVEAGVPVAVLVELIKAYSYDVDFQRDIQPGDSFEVMFERESTEDGRTVREGDVHYAALTLSGRRYEIYRYEDTTGDVDYYDAKGHSVRKALLRTPINGARLSSGFGMRRHPVLGYSKMHKGSDFAAPTGTPIYAAGDGVIAKSGPFSSYGNYVRIRHNSEYDTAYAHMHRIAKGMTPGKRVKQGDVIGYVGSTGRSTGPHLHYEILKNGKQVNPQKVRFPTGRILEGTELARFKETMGETRSVYASLPSATEVAAAK